MPIVTRCPNCRVQLGFPDNARGQQFKCPQCAAVVTAPASPPPLADAIPVAAPVVAAPLDIPEAAPPVALPIPSVLPAPARGRQRPEAAPWLMAVIVLGGVCFLTLAVGLIVFVVASALSAPSADDAPRTTERPQPARDVDRDRPRDRVDRRKEDVKQAQPRDRDDWNVDVKPKKKEKVRPREKDEQQPVDRKDEQPQEERAEKLTRRASLTQALAEIRPPGGAGGRSFVALPGNVQDVVVGRAGRYLLLKLGGVDQVAVFDVSTARLVKLIPLSGTNAKIAAGRDHLVIVYPSDQKIERWSLVNFSKEAAVDFPMSDKVTGVALGSGSRGPLYLASGGDFDSSTRLLDVATLKPLALPPQTHRLPRGGHYLRAALDGTTFCMRPDVGSEPHSMSIVTLNGATVTSKEVRGGHCSVLVPGPDGRFLYGGDAVYSADGLPIHPNPPPQSFSKPFVPGVHGPYFMKFNYTKWNQLGGTVEFFLEGTYTPFAQLGSVEGISNEQIAYGKNRDILTPDKRVTFIPRARMLVCIPKNNDKLILMHFDPQAALKQSGKDYLAVVSEPETEAKKGQAYQYRIDALASGARVAYELQAGPEGMRVAQDGLVTWNVPPTFAGRETRVIVNVTAGDRQVFHSFPLEIVD
jgi:hypothetical protein